MYPQSQSRALYHLATPLISFGRLSFSLAWKWEFFPSSLSCNCNEASLEVQLVLGSWWNLRKQYVKGLWIPFNNPILRHIGITEWLLDNAQALGIGRLPAFKGNQTYVRWWEGSTQIWRIECYSHKVNEAELRVQLSLTVALKYMCAIYFKASGPSSNKWEVIQ